jgi:poly(3-hydroxybutyrate) depolymerase
MLSRSALWLLGALPALAATDVRFNFTLNTSDADGAPLKQNRSYIVYRPDGLSRTTPVPMILLMDGNGESVFRRKADEAGIVLVTCNFAGNSTGNPGMVWVNDNPRIVGYEDYDYTTEVINRVRASDNIGDVFIIGLSKGGHMALAYACVRPETIKAAASVDEFMGLTSNLPSAPVPILMFEGTSDTNVPYAMVKDTIDAWRAVNGLSDAPPVTTYESSPRIPGRVSQATWSGGTANTQVALVTIIGGTHNYAMPSAETGYDSSEGAWAFFSQYLTGGQGAPRILNPPVGNVQTAGQAASFRVTAAGSGPLSYQWQRNGEDIPGATANWFTLPNAASADEGASFRVVVSNDSGSVTSAAATLKVNALPAGPVIATNPADQTLTAGQPVSFTVTATGTGPLSYQWRKNGVNIAGATTASLSIPAAISADSGASFTVVVTSGAGSATSTRATLTVTPATGAPIMLAHPQRSRVLAGQRGRFSVTAWSESPMTYQWQKGAFNGNMADIPGATDSTYTTAVTTPADHLTLFRCVVSNAGGNVTSASEMLFVTAAAAPPSSIDSPIAAAAQMGAPFAFAIESSGGTSPVTYSAGPLPAGLSVDPDTGMIAGVPAETGVTNIAVSAGNSAGSKSGLLRLTVMDTPPPISLDDWRLAIFRASATDPAIAGDTADPDGDGYANLDEFQAGTNPLDSASVPVTAPGRDSRARQSAH